MRKENKIFITLATIALFNSVFPLLHLLDLKLFGKINIYVIVFVNFIGWGVLFWVSRAFFKTGIQLLEISKRVGIDTAKNPIWEMPKNLGEVIEKKNSCFSLNIAEQKIETKEDLARSLEKISEITYKLLSAESVELALFEKDSARYHSSFVLGKPFSDNPQEFGFDISEMLRHDPKIMVEPISFAGSVRGLIRVKIKNDRTPTVLDKELMSLLATQSTIAIINSEYTNEMIRLKVISEQSVKAKTGFLANLSHEIRGPLGIMLNAVELIIDGLCGEINEDQKETLTMIKSNGAHLLELMNDVLDYAKAESGRISITKVDINVNDLLEDIVKIIKAQAESKKHQVTYEYLKDDLRKELHFSCDRRHARQILINILTNAIKYTPDGGKIELYVERNSKQKFSIHIRDNGVGIEQSQQYKVFAPFERVDNNYSLKQLGTGLGMSLAKKLVETNGGQIQFESELGKGTHFWITFDEKPVEVDTFIDHNKVEEEDNKNLDGYGKEILIVSEIENNESLLMRRYLEDKHFKIIRTSNLEDAISSTDRTNPDLVIIENDKVDTFGAEFIRSFREKAKNTKANANAETIPIVLISNKAFVFDIEELLKSGVDRCLTRPVEFKEIARVVNSLIG